MCWKHAPETLLSMLMSDSDKDLIAFGNGKQPYKETLQNCL